MPAAVAFFDLDKTLLAVNSMTLWIRQEWSEGRLDARTGLEAAVHLIRYRFGASNMEEALRKSILTLQNTLEQDLRDVAIRRAHLLDLAPSLDGNPFAEGHQSPSASRIRSAISSMLPMPSTSASKPRSL